jgi:multidrug efflux pump subunit AcrA (membrane-fusion protein)
VGEVVSPNSQAGSSARGSVATMVDLDSLEAQAEVPETSLPNVTIGAPAQIFLDAYPGSPYAGRVDRIWPTADRQKATVEVRIAFEALDSRLRPEMGVRVVFLDPDTGAGGAEAPPDAVAASAVLVPEDALVPADGQHGVFVLERDTVRFAPLELGARRGGRVIVHAGLAGNEEVVRNPPATLASGDRVRRAGS